MMLTTEMNTYTSFKCLEGLVCIFFPTSVTMVTLGKTSITSEVVFCDKGFKTALVIHPFTFPLIHLSDERICTLQRNDNLF